VDIVPSQAARNGNLSTGTVLVDPEATRYLAFYPVPNRGLIGNGDTGNFAFAGQQITPETYFTTRIDYKILRRSYRVVCLRWCADDTAGPVQPSHQ